MVDDFDCKKAPNVHPLTKKPLAGLEVFRDSAPAALRERAEMTSQEKKGYSYLNFPVRSGTQEAYPLFP
jgi:hypothetical protein